MRTCRTKNFKHQNTQDKTGKERSNYKLSSEHRLGTPPIEHIKTMTHKHRGPFVGLICLRLVSQGGNKDYFGLFAQRITVLYKLPKGSQQPYHTEHICLITDADKQLLAS